MTTQIQRRRGTTAQHSTFTGAEAELTVDTTKDTVVVHDGATTGGRPLLREDQSNLPTSAPTTGIYNASGSLAISTSSVGRLFVDSSGRVGIGASPQSLLHLETDGTALRIVRGSAIGFAYHTGTAATDPFRIQSNGGSVDLFSAAGQPITFSAGTTEKARITSDGRLGLGTSGPLKKAEIRSTPTTADTDGLRVGDGTRYLEFAQTGATYNYMQVGSNRNLIYFSGSDLHVSTDGANAITLNTNSLERVRVTSDGRVGVGTAGPGATIDLVSESSAALGLRVRGRASDNISVIQLTDNAASAQYGTFTTTSASLDIVHNSVVRFLTGSSERGRFDSSGRLLVGTSSDSGGALLQVNGDRIRVGTAKTPASATAAGTAGEICWDTSYVYVCTATNTWKRSALSTW